MSAFVGIDVSKATLDIVLLIDEQQTYQKVPNNKKGFAGLIKWLHSFENIEGVCLEATGRYGDALAKALYLADFSVSVENPLRIKSFAQSLLSRNKTDKYDAFVIALYAQRMSPEPWKPPTDAIKCLKQRTRLLHSLEQTRQSYRNRLKSGMDDKVSLQIIRSLIKTLDQQIEKLKKNILNFIKIDDHLNQQRKLIISILGIADKTAAILLAEIGDIDNFKSPRALASYVGITPRIQKSGTSVHRRSHISKQGNKRLRTALYFPAISAKTWNPICRAFALKLEQGGLAKKAIVIAVMRKLLHQVYGILKSKQPFDPHFQRKYQIAA
jgi:transposase